MVKKPKKRVGKVLNRRLEKLADKLMEVHRVEKQRKVKKFDMALWRDGVGPLGLSKNACGTSACALGWAKAGLRFHDDYDIPTFENYDGTLAGAKFFNLERTYAQDLFHGRGGAFRVAQRARRMARDPEAQGFVEAAVAVQADRGFPGYCRAVLPEAFADSRLMPMAQTTPQKARAHG